LGDIQSTDRRQSVPTDTLSSKGVSKGAATEGELEILGNTIEKANVAAQISGVAAVGGPRRRNEKGYIPVVCIELVTRIQCRFG
jgi:hypothetical protein